jgi:hypothetical protein
MLLVRAPFQLVEAALFSAIVYFWTGIAYLVAFMEACRLS